MRAMSFVKAALVAAVVALPLGITVASAKVIPPPGACAVDKKKFIIAGALCSFECSAQTLWCAQQYCVNGALVRVLPCYGAFCAPKCGG
jgi:hypothetical protein